MHLAEAHLTLLALPFGTQAKLGQMRNRFGLLNQTPRPRPALQSTGPTCSSRFFGEEGLVERGAELTWVAPLPFYLELLGGVFNGDNESAFGSGKLNQPLLTGRVRTFFELDELRRDPARRLGGERPHADRHRSTLVGVDAKYKYTPGRLAAPAPHRRRRGAHLHAPSVTYPRRADVRRRRHRSTPSPRSGRATAAGWYAYAEVQPWRRWALRRPLRLDGVPRTRGREWAVEPYVTFMPSEFLRFRLGYKHTERDKRDGFGDNGGSARIVDELLLQATFILGAHPAHPF